MSFKLSNKKSLAQLEILALDTEIPQNLDAGNDRTNGPYKGNSKPDLPGRHNIRGQT